MEEKLKEISSEIIKLFREKADLTKKIKFKDYHGFTKGKLPKGELDLILKKLNLKSEDFQIEIVKVLKDLSKEIHFHNFAHAFCTILSSEENFDDSANAYLFLRDKWKKVSKGEMINIPQKTPHGFTIKGGGILTFLSVQTPPIEKGKDDDYFQVD